MAREKLKEALLKHHAAKNLDAPIGAALDEAAENLVALFELLVEEERRQGGNNGTPDQRDSVHPDSA